MPANCALGSFVACNLGGCSVSGRCDLDQGRSPVRKPSAALGGSWHAWGGSWVRRAVSGGRSPSHGYGWLLSSITSNASSPPPPRDEGLCREEVAQQSRLSGLLAGSLEAFPFALLLPMSRTCPLSITARSGVIYPHVWPGLAPPARPTALTP